MTTQDTNYTYNFLNSSLDLHKPSVMGILNIAPDSFYDGGKYSDEKSILNHVETMLSEGATIIDVGACSTRPGAIEISEEEEERRLMPVLQTIRKKFTTAIVSVDTFRASIAIKAVDVGANIINDISGGTLDKNMFSAVAKLNVPYILMHIQGNPQTMQQNPIYANVTEDVKIYFTEKIRALNSLGVKQLIIDPGFGFGKTVEHNFTLLKNLCELKTFGYPVLAGLSRKSMINRVINTKPAQALNGTTVLNTIALLNGANILRVHDVKEAMEAIKLVNEYVQ
ncbi:MAG: dihydropteroate synthase [Bacteroidia bacterium]|nr:dihydropteroate synthase [Bacteroidia bacterium]